MPPQNVLNVQIPVGTPIVEADGRTVTQAWYFFFMGLSKRTSLASQSGAAGGLGIASGDLADNIEQLAVEGAFADINEPTSRVLQLLQAVSADGDAQPAIVDPFIASLLISDV